ncbi:class I SAM-dependent DNA methyltransferase [Streptococcus sp. sy018]|uniref:HsdM family class I SAM-dependent methyltransferase n=1 Tax=Streptococcus sp. sy018 TaxID=2600147 RepID=UPI0011B6F4FE|nr:N-6 DNA methylase [Streptococcus sp. sy018]TWS95401.1 N-6 DNA methylase [Streptococcus sp. sy018]
MNWRLESDVNDWVKAEFHRIGLKKHQDYNEESSMSDYLKEALKGAAKTATKTNFGKPDFHIENKYKLPIIIENKLKLSKLVAKNRDGIKFDDKSINAYAVNGALHYSRSMIDSGKYEEVIAIGIAGDDEDNITISVYYVFGSAPNAHKELPQITTLDFLESQEAFDKFYQEATLTEADKHQILIDSQATLQAYAKKLNKLMHNHNITAPQRVLYVSGMLLSMQDVLDGNGDKIADGLTPDDLQGVQLKEEYDGVKIYNKIKSFLGNRGIAEEKRELMLASFAEISKDSQRDEKIKNDKEVAKHIDGKSSSINKQIFVFIYEYIFKQIDGLGGHIDIMGEMYSEFLKYALGDGKEIGIVLTPPYVTKMMAQILDIKKENKVMDLATGSAGFLISAMELMIDDANITYGKSTTQAKDSITRLKKHHLLGIELNAEMYTLATTNMILRGDGSSRIEKGSAFNRPKSLFTDFEADRVLLNPPFSYSENGLPFIEYGLNKMKAGGKGAIIIQDSAGSGKGISTAKKILANHTLLASIKMPVDLFVPMAGVQTSIYIFEAHKPHDYDQTVKFIDFRQDGYKRAKRGLSEIDNPQQRYQDIVKIFKAGTRAKVDENLWDLEQIYIEDFITDKGNDWNFEQHQVIDTKPTLEDFKKTVADYLSWEVTQLLQSRGEDQTKKP